MTPGAALAQTALLGLGHFAVDVAGLATTADLALQTGADLRAATRLILAYNFLAFAPQIALGWLADRYRLLRAMGLAGCVLAAAGVLVGRHAPWPAVLLVATGNALFHVGAGGLVLRVAGGRAGLAGLFVGPGDLGVLVGVNLGRGVWGGSLVPFALAGLAAAVPLLAVDDEERAAPARVPASVWPLVGVLCGAVLLRGVLSTWIGARQPLAWAMDAGLLVTAGVVKTLAGFVADRVGWLLLGVVGAAAAIPCFAAGPQPGWQSLLATACVALPMPLTLAALSRLLPMRPGLAFGLTALWVYLGSPPFGNHLVRPALPGLACALQAACTGLLWVGLRATKL
jgi:FSR family fosmidomycin resistance protein-like MFS transporter